MSSVLVVLHLPVADYDAGVGQRPEQVQVEAFVAEPSVERFDVAIRQPLAGWGAWRRTVPVTHVEGSACGMAILRIGGPVKCAPGTLSGNDVYSKPPLLSGRPASVSGSRDRSWWGAWSGCGRCGCARPVGGLKQFDEVAGGVGEQDLASAGAGDHVAAE